MDWQLVARYFTVKSTDFLQCTEATVQLNVFKSVVQVCNEYEDSVAVAFTQFCSYFFTYISMISEGRFSSPHFLRTWPVVAVCPTVVQTRTSFTYKLAIEMR